MAKSSKKTKDAAAPELNAGTSGQANANGASGRQTKKPIGAKMAARKALTRSKTAGTTRPANAPRKSAVKMKEKPSAPGISDEDIRMRAYFISEWRANNDVAGDSANDWLQAVRQLQKEARQVS